MNFMTRSGPFGGRRVRQAFSFLELILVVTIMGTLVAVSTPVMSSLISNTRMDNALSRLKGAFVQAQSILADNLNTANRTDTMPRIPGASYGGVALVVRWDNLKGEYEIFHAQNNQAAKDTSGAFLESMTPSKKGYSRVTTFEPMTLGNGIRVAGVRRNNSKPSGLELIPDNFAICLDAQATATPSQQQIYVNLQTDTSTLAGAWNTSPYAGGSLSSSSTGEGFLTSLPVIIVYPESAASGLVVDSNLDPNTLIRTSKGRVMMCPLQGGSPVDF